MNKLGMNNTILPILSVLALCIGNYLRLGEVDIQTLEHGFFAIATGVATLLGIFGVIKDKNDSKEDK